MKLPWSRAEQPPFDEPAPTVTPVDGQDDVLWVRQEQPPREWEPKPPDLLEALRKTYHEQQQAQLPGAVVCEDIGSLNWTTDPPEWPGLYWWRPSSRPDELVAYKGLAALECVVLYGSGLATLDTSTTAATYRSVKAMRREWAGPISLPPDFDYERWWALR